MTYADVGTAVALLAMYVAGSLLLVFGLGAGWVTGYNVNDDSGQTPVALGLVILFATTVVGVLAWVGIL